MKSDFIRDNPLLIQALRQARYERTEAVIKASKNCTYIVSEDFKHRMERLIEAQRKPYYKYTDTRAKKTALVLAATLVIMLATVFSVSALREPVVRFIVETFELFSSVIFERPSSEELPLPEALSRIFIPEFVPEGFVFDEEASVLLDRQAFFFFSGDDGTIEYRQLLKDGREVGINTEGVVHEYILVGGHKGIFFSNLGMQTILWADGRYGFYLTGPVSKETLVAMALSLSKK